MRTLPPIVLMGNNHEVLVAETLRARIPREVLLARLREAATKAHGAPAGPGVPLQAQLLKLPNSSIPKIHQVPIITIVMNNHLTVTSLPLLVVTHELIVHTHLLRDKYAGCPLRTIVDDPLLPLMEMILIFL